MSLGWKFQSQTFISRVTVRIVSFELSAGKLQTASRDVKISRDSMYSRWPNGRSDPLVCRESNEVILSVTYLPTYLPKPCQMNRRVNNQYNENRINFSLCRYFHL